jgi:hypothetical protein
MRNIPAGVLVGALLLAPVAWSKPDHGNQGNHGQSSSSGYDDDDDQGGHGGHHDRDGDHGHDRDHDRFSDGQRRSCADWYHQDYARHCPPGLAKKHNGCMPPGLAKRRYAIGAPLPHGVVLAPIPTSLAIVLGPPPSGYRYGLLDGDVVKLAVGTALVVDAIEGLTGH